MTVLLLGVCAVVQMTVAQMTVLKLEAQLADVAERQDVGDPLDHERRRLLLVAHRVT